MVKQINTTFFKTVASSIFILGLIGCSGSGTSTLQGGSSIVDFVVSLNKGPVDNATCELFNDRTGASLTFAGGAATETTKQTADGSVTFPGVSDHGGVILVQCVGGTYTDESSGEVVTLAATLSAVKSVSGSNITVVVSPLTEIAVRYRIANPGMKPGDANRKVARDFGLLGKDDEGDNEVDITEDRPTDVNTKDTTRTTTAETKAGLYGAALSKVSAAAGADLETFIIGAATDVIKDSTTILTTYKNAPVSSRVEGILDTAIKQNAGKDEDEQKTVQAILDDAPVVTGITPLTVAENVAYTSNAPMVSSAPLGDPVYSLSGADGGSFTINADTGIVSLIATDHENPGDSNGDNIYEFAISLVDSRNTKTTSAIFRLTVTNVTDTLEEAVTGPKGVRSGATIPVSFDTNQPYDFGLLVESNNLVVTYSSSDNDIASINPTSGIVTIKATGTVVITVSVQSGNVGGNTIAAGNVVFTLNIAETIIPAPSGLSATVPAGTAGRTSIALNWTVAPVASGGESTVVGYTVFHSTSAGVSTGDTRVKLADNRNLSRHTVTSLTGGTTYYFRIAARDGGGAFSALSNEASATTRFDGASFIADLVSCMAADTPTATVCNRVTPENLNKLSGSVDFQVGGVTPIDINEAVEGVNYIKAFQKQDLETVRDTFSGGKVFNFGNPTKKTAFDDRDAPTIYEIQQFLLNTPDYAVQSSEIYNLQGGASTGINDRTPFATGGGSDTYRFNLIFNIEELAGGINNASLSFGVDRLAPANSDYEVSFSFDTSITSFTRITSGATQIISVNNGDWEVVGDINNPEGFTVLQYTKSSKTFSPRDRSWVVLPFTFTVVNGQAQGSETPFNIRLRSGVGGDFDSGNNNSEVKIVW